MIPLRSSVVSAACVILGLAPCVRAATTDWMTTRQDVLEMKLVHLERATVDGGILELDLARRRLVWRGIENERGCRLRVESSFDDVRSVSVRPGVGFSVDFRQTWPRLVFLPLPHATWLANRSGEVNLGSSLGLDALPAPTGGSDGIPLGGPLSFGGPSSGRQLPAEVSYDTRKAVNTLLEALGRAPAPGSLLRESFYGSPVEVTPAELATNAADYEGQAVRLRGQLEERGDDFVLRADNVSVLATPVPELRKRVRAGAAAWRRGDVVDITGVVRRELPERSKDTRAPVYAVSFWEFSSALGVAAPGEAILVGLSTVVLDGTRLAGQQLRVVGQFAGRNASNELPEATRRRRSDWVIKDGEHALWVTGKGPKGPAFSLDTNAKNDRESWVEITGTPEVHDGVTYLRAQRVALAQPPAHALVKPAHGPPGRAAIVPALVFSMPVDGEDDVPRETQFVVQFNKPMDPTTFAGRVRLRYVSGEPLRDARLSYDESRRALLVDPGDLLRGNSRLELALLPGILDADGMALPAVAGAADGTVQVLHFQTER